MTRYIMIIIQFLYNKFSQEIKRKLLPFYILHIFAVILMIVFSEAYRDQESNESEGDTENTKQSAKQLKMIT